MPHQCLSCGHTFEEGSSALLDGCPQCKGTRFFYSQAPVSQEEREELQAKAQKDIRHVVADLLKDAAPEAAAELQASADADGWAELKPKDLRKLVKKVHAETKDAPASAAPYKEPVESKARRREVEAARQRILEELAQGEQAEAQPDTVTVESQGEYAIDIKGLLEKEPIVVQKDGAYLIHLPSLFKD